MDNTFKRFLHKLEHSMHQFGIKPGKEEILVACSGGLDSTVLLRALYTCGYRIQVAHVNYCLRAEESDQNQKFVEDLCSELSIQFHCKNVEMYSLVHSSGRNLQDLAREIRYSWFEELTDKLRISYIATAHHLDDQAETLLYNFIKGSGLKGLRGIAEKNNKMIRPFLNCSRTELVDISQTQGWEYSKDSSNDLLNYSRNRIRHEILPDLQKINPAVIETLAKQARIYQDLNLLLDWTVKQELKKIITPGSEESTTLHIPALISVPGYSVILYELLKKIGFNSDQVKQVAGAVTDGQSGLLLYSNSHKILVDRNTILITKTQDNLDTKPIHWPVDQDEIIIQNKLKLTKSHATIEECQNSNQILILEKVASVDVYIRSWKPGDYFYPTGMQGKKKLSDFFIDKKLNRFEKEQVRLLVNEEDQIIWVIGYRADRRFVNNGEAIGIKITMTIL